MLDTTDKLGFALRWFFLGGAVSYWAMFFIGLVAPHALLPAGNPMFPIFGN